MLKAIIFDFDGVIADTEPLHLSAFQKVLGEKGITLNSEDYYEIYLGMDDKECFNTVLKAYGINPDKKAIQSLIEKKTAILMDYLKNNLFIYPGVINFIDRAKENYLLAIASGALRHEIEFILNAKGIDHAFTTIVSAEDVRAGKPDPECFLIALKRLNHSSKFNIEPEECVVIEDSIAGLEAARGAGMRSIGVTNTYGCEKLTMADIVIKSLEDITMEDLERL